MLLQSICLVWELPFFWSSPLKSFPFASPTPTLFWFVFFPNPVKKQYNLRNRRWSWRRMRSDVSVPSPSPMCSSAMTRRKTRRDCYRTSGKVTKSLVCWPVSSLQIQSTIRWTNGKALCIWILGKTKSLLTGGPEPIRSSHALRWVLDVRPSDLSFQAQQRAPRRQSLAEVFRRPSGLKSDIKVSASPRLLIFLFCISRCLLKARAHTCWYKMCSSKHTCVLIFCFEIWNSNSECSFFSRLLDSENLGKKTVV